MLYCKYCNKECKNKNSLAQHEIRCNKNPNKIDMSYIKIGHSKGHKGTNQFIKAKELNLDIPIVSEETKMKIGLKSKNHKHSDLTKQKISEGIRKAIINNPQSYNSSNVNGRVKHCKYKTYTMDSSWELLVAKYLDILNIKQEKPKNFFLYNWNNSIHKYFPDFYLCDYNIYIEVKGYERERDIAKYNSINNLIIIKKKEINLINDDKYNIFNEIIKIQQIN